MFDKNEGVEEQEKQPADIDIEVISMIGEGKKYGTVEAALKSIKPAQDHIVKLEAEAKELRDKLKALEESAYEQQLKIALSSEEGGSGVKPAEINIDKVVNDAVTRALTQTEKESQNKARQKVVVEAAIKTWGDSAESNLYAKAGELGLSPEQINQLSATSPEAALKLLGLEPAKPITQYVGVKPTIRTTTKQQPIEKPAKPSSWGNDQELVEYIRKLDAYLAQNK